MDGDGIVGVGNVGGNEFVHVSLAGRLTQEVGVESF